MTMRILHSVVLVLLGALVGAIGTIAHQSTLEVASMRLPSGIVLGLLMFALLVTGIRLVAQDRWAPLWFALGAIAVVALFSLRSVGGSVLIPDNLAGQLWVFGPAVICAIVIAWPRVTLRRTVKGPGTPLA